jgi:phenylalanyl-tRNA synthetase beta chain
MKIPLSWLREYVDVPGTPEEIAATMSVRGFAVEGIDAMPDGDAIIDFEITANRPDCMSVIGMAREIATAYALQVRRPVAHGRPGTASRDAATGADRSLGAATPPDASRRGVSDGERPPERAGGPPPLHLLSLKAVERSEIDVAIEAPGLCPRYAGAVADVRVADSPEWMQQRLRAAGVRPISNIVDVTNYVLLELGQPMHAFDLAKLEGQRIRVRTAAAGESIRTLDGQVRALAPDMLVIADEERAVAVAGVMGGADSEVTASTTAIVLESAYFDPLSVRRTSRKLGLKTEASMRFERGADPRLPITAMERACALLEAIGAGTARGTVVDRYPTRVEPRQLKLRRGRLAGLLGAVIPDADARRILDGLGFALKDADDGWDVTVPTRRVDVRREVDLIEEVARHFGFDRIPVTFPALTQAAPPVDPRIVRARQLRTIMTGAGFSEAVTFGFIGERAAAPFAAAGTLVPIENPLSENFAVLRPSVLPGLIDAVAHNRRREQPDVRLFEFGARFSLEGGERRALGIAWTGSPFGGHWSGGGRTVDFFDLKGLVERVCEALGVAVEASVHSEPWLVPGRTAAIRSGDTQLGAMGQLLPAIADRHGLPSNDAVYLAEIDLDALDARRREGLTIEPLPKYPSVTRDISVLVDAATTADTVRESIRGSAPGTLTSVREFDRYQGKGIPEDKVSLSLRLVFRSPDRTLTDHEVQSAMDAILAALRDGLGAIQR